MDLTLDRITGLVTRVLAELVEKCEPDYQVTSESTIYGSGSPLDSTALVSMIIDVEMCLDEEFGLQISLTDERALSQEFSPFKDVPSLSAYIFNVYKEQIAD